MPNYKHLNNAPIIEAIIDLRVKARPGFRAEEFGTLKTELEGQFPKMEKRHSLEAGFEVRPGKGHASSLRDLGLHGYFFKAENERTIVQFRVDGFTFNRLRPYTSWEELFPIAMNLWQTYIRLAKPEVVIRLAVRYINHIPLPFGPEPFEHYLTAPPIIPPQLPQHVSSFLTRVTIQEPTRDIAANIAQALVPSADPRTLTIILDIDAYKQGQYAPDDPHIEDIFLDLRSFKNSIFFNSLTEKTLRQFE